MATKTKSDPLSIALSKDAGKSLLQRINERNAAHPMWRVEVIAKGNVPEIHYLREASEFGARSCAMLLYTQALAGQSVEYSTTKLS